jgi:cytochrome c peroxidase
MKKTAAVGLVVAHLVFFCTAAQAQDVSFTDAEIRAILAHGPWPTPLGTDPSNRVSGKREAIELGERLFFDQRMSGNGRFSCGTCHVPERNWTDNLTRGRAAAEVDRNTPTLMNIRLGRWFGWDGASDSIWSQSMRPILDARELGATVRHVADLMRKDEQLSCRYRRAFGAPPSGSDDEAVLVDVAKALAAFQETFETPPTPFDGFRNALARGEKVKAGMYSDAAQRGLKLFVAKGTCNACHSGPNFTNGEFANNGFPKANAQAGRVEGLKHVNASRFNLLGKYNDDPQLAARESVRRTSEPAGKAGAFKVPTLRHLFLTAPYGHRGELASLGDVVKHYGARFELTGAEQSDLVVFLESLSTFNNPWRPEDLGVCR